MKGICPTCGRMQAIDILPTSRCEQGQTTQNVISVHFSMNGGICRGSGKTAQVIMTYDHNPAYDGPMGVLADYDFCERDVK